MSLFLCILAAALSFLLGRAHITAGLGSVLTFGYLYGILRANLIESSYAHFIFDCAVAGFYLSAIGQINLKGGTASQRALMSWTTALLAWAVLMFLIPIQHPLIQLVGLRGNAFLIPFIIIGGVLEPKDFNRLAIWMAGLNVITLGFGVAEYIIGVQTFYPKNQVTEIIYNSTLSGTSLRIPATFVNAHTYAGTMVSTIPWLIGALTQQSQSRWRLLIIAGILGALLGVFMTATRVGIVVLAMLIAAATFSRELKGGFRFGWIGLLIIVIFVVSSEERMQRFTTLADTEKVVDRFSDSVNMTFVELLFKYPFGTGMGAGGTSLPFFLRHYLTESVMIENEYGRILLEQGIGGLVLWISFIGWLLTRPPPRAPLASCRPSLGLRARAPRSRCPRSPCPRWS